MRVRACSERVKGPNAVRTHVHSRAADKRGGKRGTVRNDAGWKRNKKREQK